ncbi:CHAT domain-containing tetratricopeptide repeat protein [Paraflavisolibacter sp. H34]|uniref:CHAT domain-containing tetratricopeptide repeat protein n=1 Tax=Huijunlia imazamoxiresistens TaxID=3127457 RepID=UPI003019EB42
MKELLKNVILSAIILVGALLAPATQAGAQPPRHDSLRLLLAYFRDNTREEPLRKAVQEALDLYAADTLTEPLSLKLLQADSLMMARIVKPDRPRVLLYTELLVRALQQLPPPHEHLCYAAGLHKLANLHKSMGRYDQAPALYQQALAVYRKTVGEEHPAYGAALNDLANLYRSMGQYDKALALLQQALAVYQKTLGTTHPDYANGLNNLASLYSNMGQYEKALPLYQQSLAILKKNPGPNHPDYASGLNNLANLYKSMGQFEKALPLCLESLEIRRKALGEDHPSYATGLHGLANLYKSTGEYEKSLPLYQKALAIRKKTIGEQHPEYGTTLNNMASLYRLMGQYDKSLSYYQRALAIRKKVLGPEHPDYASSLTHLANLYRTMGQYQKALPLYEQALAIRKKVLGEAHPDYANGLNNLAFIYALMGQNRKALVLYRQTLALREKILGDDHPNYAFSLSYLADLYVKEGQYEEARKTYEQALAIIKKSLGEEHPEYASNLNSLGLVYPELSGGAEASALLTLSARISLKHLRQTYTTLSEQEKMAFLNKQTSQFGSLPSLLFARSKADPTVLQQVYANELVLKGMVLEDQQQVLHAIRKSGDTTALQLYEQWRLHKAFIGGQLLLPKIQRVSFLDSLQEVANGLEQQLSRRAAAFQHLQRSQSITAAEIAQKLQPGEAAVEFLRFRLYRHKQTDSIMYAALVLLPGDSTARFVSLFEERQLLRVLQPSLTAKSALTQYAAIQKLYDKPAGKALHPLYRLVWKPLEEHLAGVRTVYYAPVGLLHRIAFQALRKDADHFLIDFYQLRQVLSTRAVVLHGAEPSHSASISLWGDIDYNKVPAASAVAQSVKRLLQAGSDTGASAFNFYTADTRGARGGAWGALPGAKREMDSIGRLFRAAGMTISIDSGAVASEETFKGLSGKSPQVLHLATHGFFLPVAGGAREGEPEAGGNVFTVQQNPMFRSGLILAGGNHAWKGEPTPAGAEDGILTAYEIAQMDLSNTDVVVLSACETALGEVQGNEGVIGLQRAFKLAGVKQLVMSLWRVPDEETTELMTLFYRHWLAGKSTRDAFRAAQQAMKEKHPPYYWAAFVLVE